MKFEDLAIIGFLLALFFIVSHEIESGARDSGANFAGGMPGQGAELLKTRHAN